MHPNLDPVSVMITLLAAMLSPALSAVLGPYAVIILASGTGAAWSLGRREPSSKLSAVWFFLRVNLTACVLTSSVAAMLNKVYAVPGVEWSFALVAFAIGLIGDDWKPVCLWLIENRPFRRTGGPT